MPPTGRTIPTARWSFTLDDSNPVLQSLAVGQTITQIYTVTVSDGALTDEKEGIEFAVDNTAPSISVTAEGNEVVIRVTDKMSPVGKVEYSADAQKWIRLIPVDGIADSPSETYRLKRSALAGKFVIVRAVDAFYNVATESITLP